MGKSDATGRNDLEPLVDPLGIKVKDLSIIRKAGINCGLASQCVDVGKEATLALLDKGDGKSGDEEHADVQVGIVLRVLGVGILDIRGVLFLFLLGGEGILPILWLSIIHFTVSLS